MRSMNKILLVAALAIGISGCAALDRQGKSVLVGGTSITAEIDNPITTDQLAAVEATYNITLVGVNAYFDLRQCRRNEAATITNLCARAAVKRELQAANRKAYAALTTLRNFVANNRKLNASSAFAAAQQAVNDFKAIAFINGVKTGQ